MRYPFCSKAVFDLEVHMKKSELFPVGNVVNMDKLGSCLVWGRVVAIFFYQVLCWRDVLKVVFIWDSFFQECLEKRLAC